MAATRGSRAEYRTDGRASGTAALERFPVAYMSWKLRFEELKQFEAFTSGTSTGSARVTSAHCREVNICVEIFLLCGKDSRCR